MNLIDRAKPKKSPRVLREKTGWNNRFLKSIPAA